MLLASNRIFPPKEYYHSPTLCGEYGETVAMILADNGIIPSKEW